MTDPKEQLTEFFETELGRSDEHAPIKIELVYSPPGDHRREVVRMWHVKEPRDAWAFDKAPAHRNKLITTIIDQAEHRAETEGGTGKRIFRINVHQASGERMPCVIAILPTYDGADSELAREEGDVVAATPVGTLTQVLKQNRELHKSILKRAQQDERLIGGIAQLVTSLTKHQSEHQGHLWDRIEQLEDQRVKQLEIVEDAKTHQHQRLLEEKVVDSEQDRKDKAMEMFETVGKAIFTHLTKPKIDDGRVDVVDGPPGIGQLPAMLSTFMGSLSKDQRDELLERLAMEQKLSLAEIQKAALASDVPGTYRAVASFMTKLDETTVDMLDDVLAGKQKKLLDRIFEIVREAPMSSAPGANGASQPKSESVS